MSSRSLWLRGAVPTISASSSSAFSRASVDRSRCSAAGSSGLGDEPIADATHGFDPARFLEGAAQLICGLLDAVLETLEGAAPDAFEQLSARDRLTLSRRQQLQHQQRPSLDLQFCRGEKGLAFRRIDSQPTPDQNAIACGALAECPADAR